MKPVLLSILALSLLTTTAFAEWRNAIQPVGKPAGTLKVVRAGKPLVTIQIPSFPTTVETNAAAELQYWVREMTGASLPIVPGKPRGNGFVLLTDPVLGDEGYEIRYQRGQIRLIGGQTRGVMNAVFALLEEDLGWRFYAPDSVRLTRTNTLIVAPVARRYVPVLKLRDPFYASAFDPVWSLRNRANAPTAPVPETQGGRVDYANMFVHTAAQLVPPDQYFAEHPDYFAQQADGKRTTAQLCATHPEVARIATDYVLDVLRRHPETEIVSVSKNDSQISCLCDRCKALREAEGSDMANQLVLVNAVATAVEKEFPRVSIDTLAYLETIGVPKTARPRSNVVIRLCNDAVGSWTYPFTPAARCEVANLVSAWGKVHPRIYIWDYNVNFSHYLAPMPNLDVMADNIRFWIAHHAEGVMLQGGYQGPAEQDQLKSWVSAKLLWNPAWDEEQLTQDFLWGHYGPAAPAMVRYTALLYGLKTNHASAFAAPAGGIRYPMDAPFFTPEFLREAAAIFSEAERLAKSDTQLLRRVQRAELPLLYVQAVRGPTLTGPVYAEVVDKFETIARREKVQFLQEGGPDFESKLAGFKARMAKPSSGS